MGPCATKKDVKPQPDAAAPKHLNPDNPANAEQHPASNTTDPKKDGKKNDKRSEEDDPRYNPTNIIVAPENVSRALKKNSDAIKFPSERPSIELISPVVQASF
jgi:hypothetical protein